MKVLAICGSPRKGNTEWMLNKVLEGAKNKGYDTELVLLRKLKIKDCTGCDLCYNEGLPCPLEDDMAEVYEKLLAADVIVFGSPNYFQNVSSGMKRFMDRTNAIVNPAKLKGKKAAIVCVGGQDMNNIGHCEEVMKWFIEDHEMNLIDTVLAKAEGPGEVANPETEKLCVKLGEKLNGNQ